MILWLTEKFYKFVPWFWVIFCVISGISMFNQYTKEKSIMGSFGYFVLLLIIIWIFEKNWKILVARSRAKSRAKK